MLFRTELNEDSFRLLSELYSLLFIYTYICSIDSLKEFPSPLGVIFSLIYKDTLRMRRAVNKVVSVSSRSYILSYDLFSGTICRYM